MQHTLCFSHIVVCYTICDADARKFFISRQLISIIIIIIIVCIFCTRFCILHYTWHDRYSNRIPLPPACIDFAMSNKYKHMGPVNRLTEWLMKFRWIWVKRMRCQLTKIFHQVSNGLSGEFVCMRSYRRVNCKLTVTVDKHRSYRSIYHHCTIESNHNETYQSNTTDYVWSLRCCCCCFFIDLSGGLFGAAIAHWDRAIHAQCLTDSIKHLMQ